MENPRAYYDKQNIQCENTTRLSVSLLIGFRKQRIFPFFQTFTNYHNFKKHRPDSVLKINMPDQFQGLNQNHKVDLIFIFPLNEIYQVKHSHRNNHWLLK